MAEDMAENADPGDMHISAYRKWASGGWGGVLTGELRVSRGVEFFVTNTVLGNVEVSSKYRGSFNSVVAKPSMSQATRDVWKRWALASQQEDTPTIVQLVHPGRQSPPKAGDRGFFEPTIAPSPIPLNIGNGILERALQRVVFGTPREMTIADIEEVVDQFAYAAKLSYEAGFKGVELHGAHGYLLSTFLTPKTNLRTDAYGGTPAKRARIVIEVIRAVRRVVPSTFCVGIKMNSADVGGDESLEDSLEQVGLIAAEQIDFLEISGGSYEKPRMAVGDLTTRSEKREAFFLDYASAVRERFPNLILMVTGGFRSRRGMKAALQSGACDLVGVGRPAAIWPDLPKEILLNEKIEEDAAVKTLNTLKLPWLLRMIPIKFIGTGADTVSSIAPKVVHRIEDANYIRCTMLSKSKRLLSGEHQWLLPFIETTSRGWCGWEQRSCRP
jgi:2,4-dienoyl-CoA reductase-like NADH-dependent reductase (Old Yellow Enzyme family)